MNKAVFLDKDGTLIVDIPYNVDPDKIVLQNDCLTGLKQLQEHGYLLIIITNQAGIAHGYFKEDAILLVKDKIETVLKASGIILNGFYHCPHYSGGHVEPFNINCDCRKPKPGMLIKASGDFNIDLSKSWMIGDILNDVEAGNKAGCRSILIDNGNETEWLINADRQPVLKVKSIDKAADFIIQQDINELEAL